MISGDGEEDAIFEEEASYRSRLQKRQLLDCSDPFSGRGEVDLMLAPTEAEACSAFDSELFFSRRPNQHFSLADHISDGNGVYEDSFSCEVQNQAVVNKIQEAMAATEIANTLIGAQASEP